jgi:alginate O-acetyltransferase complex protein AlgI
MSYVIDVHRGEAAVERNPFRVALYISLFPQLIAGPIVRFKQIARELVERNPRLSDVATGMRRFSIGLAKKVLIANLMGAVADDIFSLPGAELTTGLAWLGALTYAMQIYFDFSGYSDMAIGLGRVFGFHFLENFLYPYVSRSLTEFWRRWHISLSTWFRDYLYIPLGGNRRGGPRTALNLLTVFTLCGLWHGASWNFVVWGLYHGIFLSVERTLRGARVPDEYVDLTPLRPRIAREANLRQPRARRARLAATPGGRLSEGLTNLGHDPRVPALFHMADWASGMGSIEMTRRPDGPTTGRCGTQNSDRSSRRMRTAK